MSEGGLGTKLRAASPGPTSGYGYLDLDSYASLASRVVWASPVPLECLVAGATSGAWLKLLPENYATTPEGCCVELRPEKTS